MNGTKLLITFASLILLPAGIRAHPIDSIKMKIDSIANVFLSDTNNAGIIIGIFRNGNLPHIPEIYPYGVVSKRTGIPPDSMTIFKLGSIGKTFTATVLAWYLVNQPNNVSLSDSINKYWPPGQLLPFWVPAGNPQDTVRISLLDLATHHSSLPDSPPNHVPPPNYTIQKLMEFLGSNNTAWHVRPLPYRPGTQWLYSNTGFGTLGVIMERISAVPYDSLLIRTFCDSLNMPDTRVVLNAGQLQRLAVGYENGDSTPFALATSPAFLGAGGNYSSMWDMMKYLAWNMRFTNSSLNNLLDTLHRVRLNTGKSNAWVGLAWQISHLRKGYPAKYVWKDGATRGYATFICFQDSTHTGVVVLSNSSGAQLDQVGINVLRILNPVFQTE